jgi:hypothetical protein
LCLVILTANGVQLANWATACASLLVSMSTGRTSQSSSPWFAVEAFKLRLRNAISIQQRSTVARRRSASVSVLHQLTLLCSLRLLVWEDASYTCTTRHDILDILLKETEPQSALSCGSTWMSLSTRQFGYSYLRTLLHCFFCKARDTVHSARSNTALS